MNNLSMTKTYIVAEMSANHNGSLQRARDIIYCAKESGADAIKLQTYTADTITVNCNDSIFYPTNTLWAEKNLYQLYKEAYTPWEWHGELFDYAKSLKIDCFSSPFDETAVDFLQQFNVPIWKIASPEIVHLPLIKKIAQTQKPVIMSTGMASFLEIAEAMEVLLDSGCKDITLLKCTSNYPASVQEANLKTLQHLSNSFGCKVGISDHSLGPLIPTVAVSLGASFIEKHLTISRNDGGVDSAFSMEPNEFKQMVQDIRDVEIALGYIVYGGSSEKEKNSKLFRRSIFAIKDIKKGESFTKDNIRVIRPSQGLHPRYYDLCLISKANSDIKANTPLNFHDLNN